MSDVTLREYRTEDGEAMYQLDLACFEAPFRFSRQAMRTFAEAANAITLIAVSGQKLVGFCVMHVDEGVGYVVTLDVAAPWRRKGVATRLMEAMDVRANQLSAKAMALHVFTGNAAAICFYEKLGYERIGVAEGFYGQGLNAIVYKKNLTEAGQR